MKNKAKKTTPSFICEIALKISPKEEKALLKRFEAARRIYNACLGECKKRLQLMRESKLYQQAIKLQIRSIAR